MILKHLVTPTYLIDVGGGPEELPGIGVDKNEKPHKFPPNFSNVMRLVRKTFYGRGVNTKLVYRSDCAWSAYIAERPNAVGRSTAQAPDRINTQGLKITEENVLPFV